MILRKVLKTISIKSPLHTISNITPGILKIINILCKSKGKYGRPNICLWPRENFFKNA